MVRVGESAFGVEHLQSQAMAPHLVCDYNNRLQVLPRAITSDRDEASCHPRIDAGSRQGEYRGQRILDSNLDTN